MREFEQMKKEEQTTMYKKQNQIIDSYKEEVVKNMDNLKIRADKIRIQNSNEVRSEKMNLETAITANYNKFTKEYNEQLKKEDLDKETRYYEML